MKIYILVIQGMYAPINLETRKVKHVVNILLPNYCFDYLASNIVCPWDTIVTCPAIDNQRGTVEIG